MPWGTLRVEWTLVVQKYLQSLNYYFDHGYAVFVLCLLYDMENKRNQKPISAIPYGVSDPLHIIIHVTIHINTKKTSE